MAQEKHCWLIRQNKKIQQIFERGVYGHLPVLTSVAVPSSSPPSTEHSDETNQTDPAIPDGEPCCVSLDGCAALFHPTVSQLELHVDLVPTLEGFDYGSVQGAYNLYPVTVSSQTEAETRGMRKATGGFVCVVGSHVAYSQLWDERQKKKGFVAPKKHWHVLEPDSPFQAQASIVLSPANSLVLWRSDLLHKNYGGDYTTEDLTPAGMGLLSISLSPSLHTLIIHHQAHLLVCVA
jgi:hypothetical protein